MRHWEDSVTGLKDIILPVIIPIVGTSSYETPP